MSFLMEDHWAAPGCGPILARRLSQIREASVTGSQRPAAAGLVFVSKMVELEHERYSCSAMED